MFDRGLFVDVSRRVSPNDKATCNQLTIYHGANVLLTKYTLTDAERLHFARLRARAQLYLRRWIKHRRSIKPAHR